MVPKNPIQLLPYTFLQTKVTIGGMGEAEAQQVFTLRDSSTCCSEISLDGRKVSSSVCGLCFILFQQSFEIAFRALVSSTRQYVLHLAEG
jgi:hypothetical protein